MCVHDANICRYSVFYILKRSLCQIQIQIFSGHQISYWSVVNLSLVGAFSRGRLVGGLLVGW